MATKVYVLIVKDESEQSSRVMDVPGFSHFSNPFENYPNGTCRYAFIFSGNKREVEIMVKAKLGAYFQPNLNFVEIYDPAWHRHDKK